MPGIVLVKKQGTFGDNIEDPSTVHSTAGLGCCFGGGAPHRGFTCTGSLLWHINRFLQ